MGRQDWMNAPPGSKVYVGRDLPADVTTDDLKRLFDKYGRKKPQGLVGRLQSALFYFRSFVSFEGPIRAVWAARSPPGFAYVVSSLIKLGT